MSQFTVPLVGGEVPVNTGESFPEKTTDWHGNPLNGPTHFWALDKYDKLVRVPANMVVSTQYKTTKLYSVEATPTLIMYGYATGDVSIQATRELWIGASAAFRPTWGKFRFQTGFRVYAGTSYFEGHVRTSPAGAGFYMSADDFIQFSSRAIKTDIKDVEDSETKVKAVKVKEYKVNQAVRFGPIAEDLPPVLTQGVQDPDDENKKDLGVNLNNSFWLLFDTVSKLVDRVAALEDLLKKESQ